MNETAQAQTEFDGNNTYREESYTDLRVGTIRRLIPVTADGEPDPERKELFHGQGAVMTPAGQLPLNFELDAETLADAIKLYGTAVQDEAQRVIEELRDLQRKQELASPIIQSPGTPKIQL